MSVIMHFIHVRAVMNRVDDCVRPRPYAHVEQLLNYCKYRRRQTYQSGKRRIEMGSKPRRQQSKQVVKEL